MRLLTITAIILALSACTTIPEQIQGDFPDITPARVEPGVFGSNVRWGGVILDSRNKDDGTCFEILSRDLDKYLRPRVEDQTAGRYIACKSGFHDPAVFTKGREVTMTGSIMAIETRKLDDFDYRYPIMKVDSLVLWEKRRNVVVYRGFHDPFYDPWYWRGPHWGHFPYYRRPFPMHSSGFAETRQLLPDPAIIETRE
jgi:outer membrane lipoprotein